MGRGSRDHPGEGREIEYLRDALVARGVLRNPDLAEDVRSFLESVLGSYPNLDIHLLAMARKHEAHRGGPRGAHEGDARSSVDAPEPALQ